MPSPSSDGKSCIVLSHASRLPVTRCPMNSFHARDTAMKLMKLPTTIRGTDNSPCSHPYNRVTKKIRCATRSSNAQAFADSTKTSHLESENGDANRRGNTPDILAMENSKNWSTSP